MTIEIKSYNEILGAMIRKIVADTSLNDINTGSALLTLLEAAAQVDFENNAAILSVLELLSIDATRNVDLDARGADFGLTRISAQRGTGIVNIGDSGITKRSTGLYQVKLPPISGSTTIFVNDAANWSPTGSLFIGRGTAQFEGPISYTNIVNNGTFFTITLGSALDKDHLISDVVVDSQGTADRLIAANTSILIPANNLNPSVEFKTLRDAVIASGEDSISNIDIISVDAGSSSNAGINTIAQYLSQPFPTATVINTTAITNARDVETDEQFRERVKAFTSTLARGTKLSILSAIIGISDTTDNKQVASAVITEPPKVGDPSILYMDDGSGFQPTFEGQSVDVLVKEATSTEEFLQLANFPLPRPQAINTINGPFEITSNSLFTVVVDGVDETVVFTDSQFLNPASATLSEIIVAANSQSTLWKIRFHEDSSRLLIEPTAHDAETIQVAALSEGASNVLYANNSLKFPTNEFSHIKLYQNNTLLREKEKSATLTSGSYTTWNIIDDGTLVLSVDGTPAQSQSFSPTDFGNTPYLALELADWVEVVNNKFAGIKATATSTGAMQIVSNQEGITSSLDILSGSYLGKMFAGRDTSAVGQSSDFELNRQNGNLRILTDIVVNDSITAGSADTKGQALSLETATGNYAVGTDGSSRPAQVVVMADPDEVVIRAELGFSVGSQLEITINGNNEMRLMGDTASAFSNIQAGDFIYISDRGAISSWIDSANTGIFKVVAKGGHTQAPVSFPSIVGDDTYLDIRNINAVPGVHTVEAIEDIQAFRSNRYPQIWEGDLVATPAAAPIQDIVDSINANLLNIEASIFKTNAVQLTSSTETGGSVATPVSVGNATGLFTTGLTEQTGNLSHVANRSASQDMSSFFKRTTPTSTDADGILGKTVWLDRYTYTDTKGLLTDNAEPEVLVPGSPSEILESTGSFVGTAVEYDDVLTMVSGQNKELYRSIREFLPSDTLGTQQTLPKTIMDYYINDEWTLFRPIGVNAEDSIVFIMDQDSISKTIDIQMSRTGRVNSLVPPTDFSFSANDEDNEAGITFGTLQVWSKTTNKTEFSDYAIWMRARNWYESGGAGSGGGSFMVRAIEYGPHGENYRFRTEYPSVPGAVNTISHNTFPDYTMNTYGFGSGPAIPTSIAPGDLVAVSNPSLNIFRYTFPLSVDLSAIVPGNIISISSEASFSAANSGVFRVAAVNDVTKTIDVHNPNGAVTVVGTPNEETATTVDDIIGSATVSNVTVAADIAGASDSTYFIIEDDVGTVAIWYRVTDGANTANPGAGTLGVNRVLEVPILSGAVAISVAASTSGIIGTDSKFTASAGGTDTVTITDTVNGAFAAAVDGGTPTSYGFAGVVGTSDITIDGTYFIVPDGVDAGDSVAIWYDLTGLTAEPLHGASRSIEISTVAPGDTAATIASKTAVFLAADGAWVTATVLGDVITLVNNFNGAISAVSAGTSTFAVVSSVLGTSDVQENVALADGINMYPLINTAVADIVTKINESDILVATEINGAGLIEYATRDEVYTPTLVGDYADALGFEHDPDPVSGNNGSIGLYDSIDWVKDYQNTDPHFALKRGLQLQGVPPTATYSLDSTPNEDATIGEMFKLVPVTVTNMLHHFTHKALSQLPIVADVNISNNMRKIQIKSQQLGSGGAVEVVGGNANGISYSIFGEGQTATGAAGDKILVRTAAFPVSLTAGDYVTVENDLPAVRKNKLENTDSIDVTATSGGSAIYAYNPKETFINQFVSFDITDVSALYSRTAGTVWRWAHDSAGSVVKITDNTLGAVTTPPDDETAAGGGVDAPGLEILNQFDGSATVAQTFDLTVSSAPLQADYFTFESLDGNKFAIWFSIDGSLTEPTGATYLAVPLANRINADYTSGASLNQIAFSVAAALTANTIFSLSFDSSLLSGATFDRVNPGDVLMSGGMTTTATTGEWKNGNLARITGDGNVSGFPIIAVNAEDTVYVAADPLEPEELFRATYSSDFTADVGGGALTATVVGTPLLVSGKLDTNGQTGHIRYESVGNYTPKQGAIRFKLTPNYSGAITGQMTLFDVVGSGGEEQITLYHQGTTLTMRFTDQFGGNSTLVGAGTFSPVAGTEYEFELNYDFNLVTPMFELFQDGISSGITPIGGTITGAGRSLVPDASVKIGVGKGLGPIGVTFDGVIDDFQMFNLPQHISTNFPGELPRVLSGSYTIPGDYVDVVNPAGQPLFGQAVGATGSVNICPTPAIEWALRHSARSQIVQSIVSAGTATVTTATPHGYNPGDLVSIIDNSSVAASPTAVTVISVAEVNTFTFATAVTDTTYAGGSTILDGEAESLYKIENLGFNDLYRLKALSGSPGFTDCGVAVDDILAMSGSTFASNNSGRFRVLGVDNDSIVYQNVVGSEELNKLTPFNDLTDGVNWTSNSDLVTGVVGNFKNISLGDWVRKPEDSDSRYLQVVAFLDVLDAEILDPALATQIVLGSTYGGTTSQSIGVSYNQAIDYEAGIVLQSTRDIRVYNVDSVEVGDTLFIDNISNDSWYSTANSGTYTVAGFGTDADLRPVITIDNSSAVTETDRRAGVSLIGFSVIEGENSKFKSIRKVEHISIDELNPDRRRIYMTPPTQVEKFSESSETKLKALGKLNYSTDITTGVDGYKYYTGLLRTVQRIVDGFEPDQASYPGRRAVGGAIEILPPLIKRISVSVDVTTAKGVNLNEISNDIKSAVINYVNNRGVGEDVILADVIVRIMNITGVAAVTFNTPVPSTERIAIADNEKSFIEPTDISVA